MEVVATTEELATGTRPIHLHRFQQYQNAYNSAGTVLAREVPRGMLVLERDYSLSLYEHGELSPVGPCNDARMRSIEIFPSDAVMERIRPYLREGVTEE